MLFTIIIATCNRPDRLKKSLAAVRTAIDATGEKHSVIVVDNGSERPAKESVASFAQSTNSPVEYLQSEPRNKAAALNAGIRAAETEWLAFTDDDALPDADWLKSATEFAEAGEYAVFGGRVVPGPLGDDLPEWLRNGADNPAMHGPAIVPYEPQSESGPLGGKTPVPLGACFFAHRDVFLKYGGYDEELWDTCGSAALGCEDAEFGIRVRKRGEAIGYCAEAVVVHPVNKERATLRHHARMAYRAGVREAVLFADDTPSVAHLLRVSVCSILRCVWRLVCVSGTSAVSELMSASQAIGQMRGKPVERRHVGIVALARKWFPAVPGREAVQSELAEFYAENSEYHKMTSSGDKTCHPQVRVLESLIRRGGEYAEIGCGGGAVSKLVGESAVVHGFDISPIAVDKAKQYCSGMNARFAVAAAEAVPLGDASVDGCYSFELLEHVWDPLAVLREMVRVTRPGGFMLISAPNRFSLDLHLPKRSAARLADIIAAGCRYGADKLTGRAYVNTCPDIDGEVYPDCDMITSVCPVSCARWMARMGCTVDFVDTTYMRAHRDGSGTTLGFQRNTARPFFKHFGDHVLILAHKNNQVTTKPIRTSWRVSSARDSG